MIINNNIFKIQINTFLIANTKTVVILNKRAKNKTFNYQKRFNQIFKL